MSEEAPPPNDPLKLMREAYAQGVERWSAAMEKLVSSEDFAAASGQLLSLYAQQQQSMRAASRVAAESIQMPTTEDLAAVAQLVINVERKVDEIADQVAVLTKQLAEIAATTVKPPPAKKPPTAAAEAAKPPKQAAATGAKTARRAPRASG